MKALQTLGAIQNKNGKVIPDEGDSVDWVSGNKVLFSEDQEDHSTVLDNNKVRKNDLYTI
jgi:hypothetical protein